MIVRFGLAAFIGGGMICAIIFGPRFLGFTDIVADSDSTVTENRVENSKPTVRRTEYEAVMESDSPERLREYYQKLKDWPDAPIVIELENLRKRHEVLDELSRIGAGPETTDFVTREKYATHSQRERIAIEHKAYDPSSNARFVEFCIDNRIAHGELSAAGMSLASISRFISVSSLTERKRLRESALANFTSALERFSDAKSIPHALAEQVELLVENGIHPEASFFATEYVKAYVDSTEANVASKVGKFSEIMDDDRQALPDILRTPAGLRQAKIKQLLVQMDSILEESKFGGKDRIEELLNRAFDLVRIGEAGVATKVVNGLSSIAGLENGLDEQLNSLQAAIDLIGSKFDPTGLLNIYDKQIDFRRNYNKSKILLFVPASSYELCLSSFRIVRSQFEGRFDEHLFRLVLVEEDKEQRTAMLEFAQKAKVRMLFLNTSTPDGSQLKERILLDKTPYIVLLDKDDRFLSFDPPIKIVADIIDVVATD